MSYGIEIRNGDDNIIIDDQYYNFRERLTGTALPGSNYPPSGVTGSGSFIPLTSDTIMARPIRSTGSPENQLDVLFTELNNAVFTGYEWGGDDPAGYGDLFLEPVNGYKYYVFNDSDVGALPDYGLAIYDEDGKLTFRSDIQSTLEVVAIIDLNINTGGSGLNTGTYNIPVGEDINDHYVFTNNLNYINIGDFLGTGFDNFGANRARYDYINNKIDFICSTTETVFIGKYIT